MAYLQIQRLPTTMQMLGLSRSTIYLHISQGLLPKPVHLGLRAVGWPAHELETILNARIAGKNTEHIKSLVVQLEQQRTSKMGSLSK